ncbi:MAG: ACT domain-containing protein [Verrucomicrobiales bacterium]|nr:ACT domain-containing protein [Verrucomicrobiales bacterium]
MKQITIITENQSGEVATISRLLADLDINIEKFEVEKGEELGVITLTVDKYDAALRAIREAGFQAITQDALLVRLEDKPGALAKIAARFEEKAIGLRSMHIIRRRNGHAHVSIVTTDNEKAGEMLKDVLVG